MITMLLKAVAVARRTEKVEILERFRREKHQSLVDRWTWGWKKGRRSLAQVSGFCLQNFYAISIPLFLLFYF